jgi:hypothetical protein
MRIVAPIVTAASGSVVASILLDSQQALDTALTSYVPWGTDVRVALVDSYLNGKPPGCRDCCHHV